MVVMTPREKWTDERLDDGFARLEGDIRELRGDLKDLRREMNARFDSLSQILIGGAIAIIVALIGLIATLIAVNAF